MFDWNDLKFFLAVASEGSTIAAAKTLGVNQSTVQRRLADLEKMLGHHLVERRSSGYQITELGKSILPMAQSIAKAVLEFEQRLAELDRADIGIVRLTCPEPIALRLNQSGFLTRFHDRHPKLKVEFVLSDKYVDLSKGEADVALRSGDTDDNALVGRKIADSLWAVYASRDYVERHGAPKSASDLGAHPIVAFEASMNKHRAMVWLNEVAPNATYAARNTSVLGLIYAVKSGLGIAPLPTALGDAEPDLTCVFGPVKELNRPWRILAHPKQRHTHGVKAFWDFVLKEKTDLRQILTG